MRATAPTRSPSGGTSSLDGGRRGRIRRRAASTSRFVAPTRDQVDQFWRVGTEAGYRDDGPPGAAAAVQRGLLRRVPARSRRQQRRGRPRLGAEPHREHRPPVDPRRRPRRSQGVLRDDRAPRRAAPRRRHARARAVPRRRRRLVLARARARRPSTSTSLSRRDDNARRRRGSTRPRRPPATPATAPPASAAGTTPATTPRSCSTPTATTSRSSTTTGT